MTKNWIQVPRLTDEKSCPMVTFRTTNSTLQFNAPLRQLAKLDVNYSVKVNISETFDEIQFTFFNDPQGDDKFRHKLSADGGGAGKTGGLICMIAALKKYKKVSAIFDNENVQKKFEARIVNNRTNTWSIKLGPTFEECWTVDGKPPSIPPSARGVYRYLDNGEIVYIGKGKIRDRLLSPERQSWKFDRVEYSILEVSDDELFGYEAEQLSQFVLENSKLPHFNRVQGHSSKIL